MRKNLEPNTVLRIKGNPENLRSYLQNFNQILPFVISIYWKFLIMLFKDLLFFGIYETILSTTIEKNYNPVTAVN